MTMRILGLSLLTLVLFSCKTNCSDPLLSLRLTGFDTSETKIVVLKKFEKNMNYRHAIDSTVYCTSSSVPSGYNYFSRGDTFFSSNNDLINEQAGPITPGYDYIVYLPAAHVDFKIDRISSGHTRAAPNGDNGCTSSLTCYVNNSMQSFGSDLSEDRNIDKIVLAK